MPEKSLMKGLRLIEALARSPQPRGIADLSTELGLAKSNVHRILKTLVETGFARQRFDTAKYELTLKLWEMRRLAGSSLGSRDLVGEDLRELAGRTGETVYVSLLDDVEVVFIHQIESSQAVQAKASDRQPAFASSTGKAILAYRPDYVVERVATTLRPLTTKTITSLEAFRAELKRIRERGYATNIGEARTAVHGVAAPIRDSVGDVISAVGVSGPAERLPPKTIKIYGQEVMRTAAKLSHKLGFRAPEEPSKRQHVPPVRGDVT